MAAPQLLNQLPPGMASFNQGFKSIGDLMSQIQQHQIERQRLMEAVKQHADMMKFKQSEEDRAKQLFGPKLNSLNQKNALMEWVMNNMPSQNGQNVNQKGLSNPSEGLSENNSPAIGGPQNSQEGMNDPNTGILGGAHQVDIAGNPVGNQEEPQANQPSQPNQPTPEFMAKYQLAAGHAYPRPYQSPEAKEQKALDLFNKKEAIKLENKENSGELLTDKTKSKYQGVIGGATTALPIIDHLIEEIDKGRVPGQGFGAMFKRDAQASYLGEISTLLDGIRNAYTIPNTDSGTQKAEDKVLRKVGESDDNYKSRLKTIRAQISERHADAISKLKSGKMSGAAEKTVTLYKNGVPHNIPESGVKDAIENWGYTRGK
jgi:hypothetical protein